MNLSFRGERAGWRSWVMAAQLGLPVPARLVRPFSIHQSNAQR